MLRATSTEDALDSRDDCDSFTNSEVSMLDCDPIALILAVCTLHVDIARPRLVTDNYSGRTHQVKITPFFLRDSERRKSRPIMMRNRVDAISMARENGCAG